MNKHVLALGVFIISGISSSIALADDTIAYSQVHLGKGGYYGVNLGVTQTKLSFTDGYSMTNTVEPGYKYDTSFSEKNSFAGIFVGYGESEGRMYIGGELGLQANSTSTMKYSYTAPSGNAYTGTIKASNYFTADVMPGYYLSETVLTYGRLGYSYGRMKVDQKKNNANLYSDTLGLNGGRLGLGALFAVTDRFALGADYVYTFYARPSLDGAKDAKGESTESLHYHPYSNSFALRAQYSID